MIDKFLSLVIFDNEKNDKTLEFLNKNLKIVHDSFVDVEIIIIHSGNKYNNYKDKFEKLYSRNIYFVQIDNKSRYNKYLLAGLVRSNGDYCLYYDVNFINEFQDTMEYIKANHNSFDILLKKEHKRKDLTISSMVFSVAGLDKYNNYSGDFIFLSRRAINTVIYDQDSNWHIYERLLTSGLRTSLYSCKNKSSFKGYDLIEKEDNWSLLLNNPSILLKSAKYILITLIGISLLSVINAFSIRFLQYDILLNPTNVVPGFAYIIALVSVGFSFVSGLLYIILRSTVLSYSSGKNNKYNIIKYSRID